MRVFILLIILMLVWSHTQKQQRLTTTWNTQLDVVLYPINADDSVATTKHIDGFEDQHIEPVTRFISRQSQVYKLWNDKPVKITLDKSITEKPPLPPANGSILKTMLWSLKFRWWSNQHKADDDHLTRIRLYVMFYDPKDFNRLPHSTGLQKGLLGIVHAFADKSYNTQNNVITVHELLHTLGATDKYDLQSGQPVFPHGYADPEITPLLPQKRAEIMGGRIPVTKTKSDMPDSFASIIIGELTAKEIGWIDQSIVIY